MEMLTEMDNVTRIESMINDTRQVFNDFNDVEYQPKMEVDREECPEKGLGTKRKRDDDNYSISKVLPTNPEKKRKLPLPGEDVILNLKNNQFNGNRIARIESEQHVAIADAIEYMEVDPSVIRGQNWKKNNGMKKRNDKKNHPKPMEVDE
jgi:hypothetical protein